MKKLVLIIMIFAFACSSPSYKIKEKGSEVKIALTSDLHYIDKTLKSGDSFKEMLDEGSDGKLSIYIEELTDAFIDRLIIEKPDIVIITGDLTFNGEKLSHETLANKLQRLKKDGIEVLVIPGNHDLRNILAYEFRDDGPYYSEWIDVDEFKAIYKDAGYTKNTYDDASLSYVFKASEDLWLLMLDTNTYDKNTNFAPSSDGLIKEETLSWIDEVMSHKPEDVDVIAFGHHPVFDIGGAPSYVIKNADELLELFDKYDIALSISGHIHAQNYDTKDGHTDFGLSSLAVYDHQYTMLTYKDHHVDLLTSDLDLEGYSPDPFFKNFDQNAEAYFKKYSTNRLDGTYKGDDIPEKISNALYELKADFNVAIFKGEGYTLKDLLYNSPYISEFEKYADTYAKSFFDDLKTFDKDATELSIVLK